MTDQAAREWLAAPAATDSISAVLDNGRHTAYESWPVDRRIGNPANDDPGVMMAVNSACESQ